MATTTLPAPPFAVVNVAAKIRQLVHPKDGLRGG
jgi:hypothetical protein